MIKEIREKKNIIPQRDRKNIKGWRLEEYEMLEDGRILNKNRDKEYMRREKISFENKQE